MKIGRFRLGWKSLGALVIAVGLFITRLMANWQRSKEAEAEAAKNRALVQADREKAERQRTIVREERRKAAEAAARHGRAARNFKAEADEARRKREALEAKHRAQLEQIKEAVSAREVDEMARRHGL